VLTFKQRCSHAGAAANTSCAKVCCKHGVNELQMVRAKRSEWGYCNDTIGTSVTKDDPGTGFAKNCFQKCFDDFRCHAVSYHVLGRSDPVWWMHPCRLQMERKCENFVVELDATTNASVWQMYKMARRLGPMRRFFHTNSSHARDLILQNMTLAAPGRLPEANDTNLRKVSWLTAEHWGEHGECVLTMEREMARSQRRCEKSLRGGRGR